MIISFIAAMDRNRVIGKDNALPWHMPTDLKRFRELTKGKPVIMGRKTYESIGKPLPERLNIVLTRNKNFYAKGCITVHSPREAVEATENAQEIFVIGGAEIFKLFLPRADKMYLTYIDTEFEGDTFFPNFSAEEWKEEKHIDYPPDNLNPHHSTLRIFQRKR